MNREFEEIARYAGAFPWTKIFPDSEKPDALKQWKNAQEQFYDSYRVAEEQEGLVCRVLSGYRSKLRRLAGKHSGKRCFIMGNGPSLSKMDLRPLRNEVTIGSNGVYKLFEEWGFHTMYYTMEDVAQVEDRRADLPNARGPLRIFGLDNAYCVPAREDTLFANVIRYSHPFENWWKRYYPGFSRDFSSCVYLGSTVTYMNLQLAFYLGCDPVYLIGVDHDYGELTEHFPPGKIEITPEVYKMLESIHCMKGYHKIGGTIGVPYVKEQEQAFACALEAFKSDGRELYNAGVGSKLETLPTVSFKNLF